MLGRGALGQSALGQNPATGDTQYLSPSLVPNASVFYSPTLVYNQTLTQTAPLSNTSAFYGPSVVRILGPSLLTNASVFYRTGAWAERNQQSETWIERNKQSETWTRAA